ncbi:MAG: heavy metal sensor histidine kinase [Syntrophorhabdaceae bacterium]|nr:heavy metal sensor histidine kinase [Syntrophorhabdaceae bacterium]MDD4196005.1 heavy metal sensor histidine kinase [Syntrophorhabdaceae bacterium]HOC46112.1 heavy metal sensor histidine kinase [Syntrophorhabdaceae bacterium]
MKSFSLPIKWKLTLWYGGILALILVAFCGFVYTYFQNSLQKSIDTKIKSIAEVLSSSMTETHGQSLFGNFERYLENALGKKPKGKFIQIIDASGKIGARLNDLEAEAVPVSFVTLEKALKGEVVYETIETARPRLRMITMPILENKKVISIVQVGSSLEEFEDTMKRLLIIMIVSIITATGGTIIVGYFMAKKTMRPVDQIRRAAVKISSSNLDERIELKGRKDELGRLADTFNAMIARLKDSFQRVNQFSIDVSHELKTPLTILKGETELALRKDRTNEEYKKSLESNLEEIDRMSHIIDDLLLLSKAETKDMRLNLDKVDLRDLLADVCLNMKIFGENKGVEIIAKELEDIRIVGDALKLRRMITNIVENGIKYGHAGGYVAVSACKQDGFACINVKDDGPGISSDDIKYIFDRFYRADKSRKRESGSGLGLSISKWIAEAHHGTIEVESTPSTGSLFIIKLPMS